MKKTLLNLFAISWIASALWGLYLIFYENARGMDAATFLMFFSFTMVALLHESKEHKEG